MLKVVHSKKRLSELNVPNPHTTRQMVEWTREFLLDLDDLISEQQKDDGD